MGRRRAKNAPTERYTVETPLEVSATLELTVATRARPAPWRRAALAALRWLPSHRDTRSGRSHANQLKLLLAALAVLLGAVGETVLHMVLAAALMLAALLLPVTEGRKREWRARLQGRTQRGRRTDSRSALVRYDGRRVAVLVDGKVWRRVLTGRHEHSLQLRRGQEAAWLGLLPGSERKAESLWFVARAADAGDALPAGTEPVDGDRVDGAVVLELAAWSELREALRAAPEGRG